LAEALYTKERRGIKGLKFYFFSLIKTPAGLEKFPASLFSSRHKPMMIKLGKPSPACSCDDAGFAFSWMPAADC